MISSFSRAFHPWATFPYILACLVLNAFLGYQLHLFSDKLQAKEPVLDMRITGWTFKEADHYFEMIGPSQRLLYQQVYIYGYDVILPLFASIFFTLILSLFYSNSLNLVPFLQFIFDMAENICVYQMINLFNENNKKDMETWAMAGSIFTLLKIASFILIWIVLFIGIVRRLVFGKEKKI